MEKEKPVRDISSRTMVVRFLPKEKRIIKENWHVSGDIHTQDKTTFFILRHQCPSENHSSRVAKEIVMHVSYGRNGGKVTCGLIEMG